MIKNIVFDMGKVMVDYDAMRACRAYLEDEEDQRLVWSSVFVSIEWVFLDMGLMTDEEALVRMQERLPGRLHEAARLCLENWHKHCMWPMEGMEDVVRRMKARGFGIYLLSNAAIRLKTCFQDVIPAIDCFDGVFFSAEEKCLKPQRMIYERFFERFDLVPRECFFIDDAQMNIDGARACGMDGYCFADRDVEKLKKVLEGLGV
jgi:putative hydrolase of the HAD superfamily